MCVSYTGCPPLYSPVPRDWHGIDMGPVCDGLWFLLKYKLEGLGRYNRAVSHTHTQPQPTEVLGHYFGCGLFYEVSLFYLGYHKSGLKNIESPKVKQYNNSE